MEKLFFKNQNQLYQYQTLSLDILSQAAAGGHWVMGSVRKIFIIVQNQSFEILSVEAEAVSVLHLLQFGNSNSHDISIRI